MDIIPILHLLSDTAKFDVSRSSNESSKNNKGGLGNGHIIEDIPPVT